MMLSANDPTYNYEEPYEVASAFNGLTIYPMNVLRERGDKAKYDAGPDGQRCEHVGFHLSLSETMYVNPKWKMNLRVNKPGGPTGSRAILTLVYAVIGRPKAMSCVVIFNTFFFFLLVLSCWKIATTIRNLFVLSGLYPDKATK